MKEMNNLERIFTEDIEEFSRSYLDYIKKVIDNISVIEIRNFIEVLLDARDRGAMVFFIGNGGSSATSSHFANDLAFGTREYVKPFRVLSLTDNVAIMTALANDNGYDEIFKRQLSVYGREGDILVGISASGNSPNIVKAFETAAELNIKTIAITAFDGGKLREISNQGIHVPTKEKEYGPAEDAHMILDHLVGYYLLRIVHNEGY